MKVMTCEQLGGPCDFELSGTTADEVIKAHRSRRNCRPVARGQSVIGIGPSLTHRLEDHETTLPYGQPDKSVQHRTLSRVAINSM